MKTTLFFLSLLVLSATAVAEGEETVQVDRGDVESLVKIAGKVAPGEAAEVRLEPKSFRGRFVVLTAVEPGTIVSAGDVVLTCDSEEIEENLEAARFQLVSAEHGYEAFLARQRMKRETERESLERAELDLEAAERAYRGYVDYTLPTAKARWEFDRKASLNRLENARDELAQLEKMYEEDELVDETEEIVLKRARWDVEYRERSHAFSEKSREFTIEYSEQPRERSLALAVRLSEAKLARTRIEAELAQRARAISETGEHRKIEKQREALADLEKDLESMRIQAPAAGILLHGPPKAGPEPKYEPHGQVATGGVILSVADPEGLIVRATVPGVETFRLKEGLACRVSSKAAGAPALDGEVVTVPLLPRGGGFAVEIRSARTIPVALLGLPVQIEMVMEKAEGVLRLPTAAVRDEDGTKFVLVPSTEGDPERVEVKLGLEGADHVEVTEGLEEGAEVLLPGKNG